MLKEIVNRLRGQVRLRVESPFPERVLNLCGARNLAFWDLEWESATAFTCRMSRGDYRVLRQAAAQLECAVTPVKKEGVPYFLGRFRHRQALAVGLVGAACALTVGSFFIWDFTVEGNVTVTDEEILRSLADNGVGLGTFGLSLDGESIRNHVLLDIPELSWIAVNVSGCRAYVQVRERDPKPEMVDERSPTNVVARREGLVLDVQALDGVACVLPGTTVTKGQLLISGVEDTGTYGARLLAGMGTVEARTWYTLTAKIPLTLPQKQYTGEEKNCFSLVFGTHRIKFFSNSSIQGENYDKITNRYTCSLLGVPLPVTIVKEQYRFYDPVSPSDPDEASVEQAKEAGEAALTAYLNTLLEGYGSVSSTLCTSRQEGDTLEVTLRAECREQIGQPVPIYTQSTNEPGGESP